MLGAGHCASMMSRVKLWQPNIRLRTAVKERAGRLPIEGVRQCRYVARHWTFDRRAPKKKKKKSEIRLLNFKTNIGRTEITHARHKACSGIMRRACTFSKNSPTAACFWTQRCDKSGYFVPGLDNGAGCRGLTKTPNVRLHSKCLS